MTWQERAACAGVGPEIFYPDEQDASKNGGAERDIGRQRRRGKEALAVCAQCPVRAECLEFGLLDTHGIWGGTTPAERRILRRERGIRLHGGPSDPAIGLSWNCDAINARNSRARRRAS